MSREIKWTKKALGELKGLDDVWSRRINDKHRLVYKVSENCIQIYQCKGHYQDK